MPTVTAPRRRGPRPRGARTASAAAVLGLILLAGCSGTAEQPSATSGAERTASGSSGASTSTAQSVYPDVLAATLSAQGGDVYALEVTMSSQYDTADRYADGWRVLDADGTEIGTMQLTHDHANEQPFTRTQSGLQVPEGVEEITVEGHDQDNGYGGATVTLSVPR